jgi:hypothetical protein
VGVPDLQGADKVNNKSLPLDNKISMRLSRVCGLAAWQRVLLTLERLDDLTEYKKDELFENSIQSYVEYL